MKINSNHFWKKIFGYQKGDKVRTTKALRGEGMRILPKGSIGTIKSIKVRHEGFPFWGTYDYCISVESLSVEDLRGNYPLLLMVEEKDIEPI